LAWNHDDVGPNRSRDELLGDVVHRGERIRRRRRLIGALGGSVALLLAVAGVATVAGLGDGQPTTELAAGSRATTTSLAVGPATGGTVYSVEAPTTVDVDVATTVVPATTVPGPERQAAATPTTTAPPAVAQPAPPGPAQPRCGPAVMQATIALVMPSA